RGGGRGGGGRGGGGRGGDGRGGDRDERPAPPPTFGVILLSEGRGITAEGSSPSFSGDGRTLAYVARSDDVSRILAGHARDPRAAAEVRRGPERVDAPALSHDGSQLAFQMMAREDWEIYIV